MKVFVPLLRDDEPDPVDENLRGKPMDYSFLGHQSTVMYTFIIKIEEQSGFEKKRLESFIQAQGPEWVIQSMTMDPMICMEVQTTADKVDPQKFVDTMKSLGFKLKGVGVTSTGISSSGGYFTPPSAPQAPAYPKKTKRIDPFARGYSPFSRGYVDHKPTQIECSVCHGKFMHTDLVDTTPRISKDDDYLDFDPRGGGRPNRGQVEDEYAYGSKETCPLCGAPDCCELELEKVPDRDQGAPF